MHTCRSPSEPMQPAGRTRSRNCDAGGCTWQASTTLHPGASARLRSRGEFTTVAPSTPMAAWPAGIRDNTAAVPPADTFARLAVGARHACGVTDAATMRCWGENALGAAPDSVPGSYQDVGAGSDLSCGLTTAGDVHCWGYQAVDHAGPFAHLFVAADVVCGQRANGTLLCWGGSGYTGVIAPPQRRTAAWPLVTRMAAAWPLAPDLWNAGVAFPIPTGYPDCIPRQHGSSTPVRTRAGRSAFPFFGAQVVRTDHGRNAARPEHG